MREGRASAATAPVGGGGAGELFAVGVAGVFMWRKFLVFLAGLGVLVFFVFVLSDSEATYEFDIVNLRTRSCSRTHSLLFGILLRESCSAPKDHPTAVRLRELGVIGLVVEEESRWVLSRGFKAGVRGWQGPGGYYIWSLGATTFGSAVRLPAQEDMAQNLWIRWATKDMEGAKRFWKQLRDFAMQSDYSGMYLHRAKEYLEARKIEVDAERMEADLRPLKEFISQY